MTAATEAAIAGRGGGKIHLPRQAEPSAQGAVAIASSASSVPPVFARSDSSTFPRTRCDHDVVIPQEGQRS